MHDFDCTPRKAQPGERLNFIQAVVTNPPEGCVIWPFGKFSTGYGAVHFKGKHTQAHRVALALYQGIEPPKGLEAAHGPCHQRACINPLHISFKTRRDNAADRERDGTMLRGEKHGNAKLSEAEALEILKLKNTQSAGEIAKAFSVSRVTVDLILSRKLWAHLPDQTFPSPHRSDGSSKLQPRGADHRRAKLTEAQAQTILDYDGPLSSGQLAKVYRVSHAAIWMIRTGRNWKHLRKTDK